jgi:hypothetical protein
MDCRVKPGNDTGGIDSFVYRGGHVPPVMFFCRKNARLLKKGLRNLSLHWDVIREDFTPWPMI